MNDSIIAKIKSLPPLDDTIIKIQNICSDQESGVAELTEVIKTDPMLTANILKAANSPLYGFSREVKNISHAVSLFGMATIRGFALSSTIRQNIKINLSPYGISNSKFLHISTLQSSLMFLWYSKVNRDLLDVLIPTSFLMEVGKIIIANEVLERGLEKEFLENVNTFKTPEELSQYEKSLLGLSNEEVASKIFEQWNLEVELVKAIEFSNQPKDAPAHLINYTLPSHIIKTAVNIFEQISPESTAKALQIVEKENLNTSAFQNAVAQATKE